PSRRWSRPHAPEGVRMRTPTPGVDVRLHHLSEAAAARACALGRDLLRACFQRVVERRELRRLAALAMGESLGEQPVREPGLPRQQRPVQICPDCAAEAASLVAALAVVPEAGDDAPEGLRARIEPRPPGVVLESR